MSTPAMAEKERAKALVREQRERERLEKEKERMARVEKLQRAHSQAQQQANSGGGGGGGARSNAAAAAASASSGGARVDSDDADSDIDAEEAAANKKEYQQRIVQLWKDKAKKPPKPGGAIRFKTTLRNTILDVFRERGWKESESEVEWDIFWANKEWIRSIYDKIHLESHQRVNHFRNFYELTRKDLLVKNLKRAKRSLAKKGRDDESAAWDFFPDTYCLPAEYSLFVEAFKKAPGISWIMKPIGSSQGKGIFLFERLNQISDWKNDYRWKPEDSKAEKYIVQRYLSDPLLVGGKKFDLRLYCLLSSERVLLADGQTIEAGDVRQGMLLAGQHGSVCVTSAPVDGVDLPLSDEMYRVTHANDGGSYVVKQGHLVSCRMKMSVRILCHQGKEQVNPSITLTCFDPSEMRWVKWGTRTYRVTADNPSSDNDIPYSTDRSVTATLVCDTIEQVRTAMLAEFEHEAERDPMSLPARCLERGDVVDVPVEQLVENQWLWDADGSRTGSKGKSWHVFSAIKMPATNVIVPNDETPFEVQASFVSSEVEVVETAKRCATGLTYASGLQLEVLEHYSLFVERDDTGYVYRNVRPGDMVKVVFVLHNPLLDAENQWSNAKGHKALTFRQLERMLTELHIPVGEEGGIVITELNPIKGETDAIQSWASVYDSVCVASMELILREFGARTLIVFGGFNHYRWEHFVGEINGVSDVQADEETETVRFQYVPTAAPMHPGMFESPTAEIAAEWQDEADVIMQQGFHCGDCGKHFGADEEHKCQVVVYKATHPCMFRRYQRIKAVLRACYGIAELKPNFHDISRVHFDAPQKYAPIEVDGNHRFQLADGTLTHNCLVTSYQPLTCYMYREGFARFSSTRFTMVKGDLTNNYVHLTNVAIQKKGEDYDAESGGKWDVRSLKLYLMHKYGLERVNALFFNIQLLCIRSLLSVQKVIINDRQSFELYGYDVLIDAQLKPWLIEVNASPSLTANTPKDYAMKLALLHDTMAVIDMEKKLSGVEEQVGGFDLIYRNGFVKFNSNCTLTTYLGCHNNRDKQLRRMWKNIRKKKAEQQGTTGQGNATGGTQGGGSQSSQISSSQQSQGGATQGSQ